MNRISKVFVLIVFVVAGLGFSVKWFVEWRARDLLDDVLLRIALWTEASYESVELTAPGNQIVVNDLKIWPRNEPGEAVTIQSLSVQVDDPLYVMGYLLGVSGRELPAAGALKLNGFSLPLASPRLTQLTDRLNNELSENIAPACGDVLFVGAREYRDMGYEQLAVDLAIDYEFDRNLKTLGVNMSVQVAQISSGELVVEFSDIANSEVPALSADLPRLSRLMFTYRNQGYVEKLMNYCAERQGVNLSDYIHQEINREDDYYEVMWGVVPGEAVRQAYANYLKKPETIEVSMAPRDDLRLEHLSMYSATDWPAMLRMQLHFNGQRVSPLTFSLPDHDFLSTALARVGFIDSDNEPPRFDPVPEPEEVPAQPIVQYQTLDLDQLDGYVGEDVRLQKINAETVDGVLVAVDQRRVRIRQKMYGGEVTLPVGWEQVLSVALKVVE